MRAEESILDLGFGKDRTKGKVYKSIPLSISEERREAYTRHYGYFKSRLRSCSDHLQVW